MNPREVEFTAQFGSGSGNVGERLQQPETLRSRQVLDFDIFDRRQILLEHVVNEAGTFGLSGFDNVLVVVVQTCHFDGVGRLRSFSLLFE
ncbi:hypothetical protein WJ31_22065 [Burkholderia ubonensis]|nr:hypothetical protein WJ31_22065 [Burkholderia ubonensis]